MAPFWDPFPGAGKVQTHINTHTHIHLYIPTYILTYRQTDRQTDRQDRQSTSIHASLRPSSSLCAGEGRGFPLLSVSTRPLSPSPGHRGRFRPPGIKPTRMCYAGKGGEERAQYILGSSHMITKQGVCMLSKTCFLPRDSCSTRPLSFARVTDQRKIPLARGLSRPRPFWRGFEMRIYTNKASWERTS